MEPLQVGDHVRVRPEKMDDHRWRKAKVCQTNKHRSYVVEADGKTFVRTRVQLLKTPELRITKKIPR